MIAALWANSNWDDTKDDKGHRKQAIEGINESFIEALEAIDDAMDSKDRQEEEKLDRDNPFFAAAERGLDKVEQRFSKSGQQLSKPPGDINYMEGLDQE